MTLTDFDLYYGVLISYKELLKLGMINKATMTCRGRPYCEVGKPTCQCNQELFQLLENKDIENFTSHDWDIVDDTWPEWEPRLSGKFITFHVPHDFFYNHDGIGDGNDKYSSSNYDSTFFLIGICFNKDVFDFEDLQKVTCEYTDAVPEELKSFKPRFYQFGNDCSCCS